MSTNILLLASRHSRCLYSLHSFVLMVDRFNHTSTNRIFHTWPKQINGGVLVISCKTDKVVAIFIYLVLSIRADYSTQHLLDSVHLCGTYMKCIDKIFMTLHHVWRFEVNLVPIEFIFHLMCMMQYNVHRNQSRAHIYWYPCSKYFSLYHNDKMKFFHYILKKNEINIENIINAS